MHLITQLMLKRTAFLSILIFSISLPLKGTRSILRPTDHPTPRITTQWDGDSTTYSLKDSHLEEYPLFKTFDHDFFYSHILPTEPLTYRNEPQKTVEHEIINDLIEDLLQEINKKKRKYTHFTVLRRKNFNRRKKCGMMTLKFNEYPFILKVCIETPKSFVNPNCKGLDNIWFFPMGGGVNRHLAGFTRIKNLEIIKEKIAQSPYWSTIIDMPRKWHWVSKNTRNIELTGYNIGPKPTIKTKIPGTYCIIADAISFEKQFEPGNPEDTQTALALCNYLENWIDAHIDNFMIEKNTGKTVIIDTEHFPTVVGMKERKIFDTYFEWYSYLASKCARDWFFRTKKERIQIQMEPTPIVLA